MKATSVLGSMFGLGDEEVVPNPKKKLSQVELAKQNALARSFAMRKIPMIGESAHVGEYGAPFIDAQTGMDITGMPDRTQMPANLITDPRMIPSYITDKDIMMNNETNVPYYIDQETGDMQPIHPDILSLRRFNPNRGMYDYYAKNSKK